MIYVTKMSVRVFLILILLSSMRIANGVSQSISLAPIIQAFFKTGQYMCGPKVNDPTFELTSAAGNQIQSMFINRFFGNNEIPKDQLYQSIIQKHGLHLLAADELSSISSIAVADVNKFLADKGFNIQLQDAGENAVYVAAVLDVKVHWFSKGNLVTSKPEAIDVNTTKYATVTMDKDDKGYQVYYLRDDWQMKDMTGTSRTKFRDPDLTDYVKDPDGEPIIKIRTKNADGTESGDSVWITRADRVYDDSQNGFDLYETVQALRRKLEYLQPQNLNKDRHTERFDSTINNKIITKYKYLNDGNLTFPVIDLDHYPNVGWLNGMIFQKKYVDKRSGWYAIAQALQQTKFKMDETGAHTQSAFAMGSEFFALGGKQRRSRQPIIVVKWVPPFTFDRPFIVWKERRDVKMPIFVGYLDLDSWVLFGQKKAAGIGYAGSAGAGPA